MSASGMPPIPPQGAWPAAPPMGAPGFSQAPVPQVISHDQPCRKCGYNLRGLATDNRCPECGTPVGFSFHGDLLRFCDPGWVETLHQGARTFVIGIAVIVLGSVVGGCAGANAANRSSGAGLLAQLVVLVGWGLTVFGWWRMTEPDPSGLGEDKYGTARQIIRISLIVAVVQQIAELIGQQLTPGSPTALGLQVVGVLFGIVSVVGFFAQLNYLKKLAQRIPDDKLSGRANFLMYALATSYGLMILMGIIGVLVVWSGARPTFGSSAMLGFGVAAMIIGIAVLVFGIMYLFLVERMGKRFKQEADAARATWAATAFAPPQPLPPPGQP